MKMLEISRVNELSKLFESLKCLYCSHTWRCLLGENPLGRHCFPHHSPNHQRKGGEAWLWLKY